MTWEKKRVLATVSRAELIATMKRMAVDKGLSGSDVQHFLDRYAFEYGSLKLLENLNAISFRLRAAENTMEYMGSRKRALDEIGKILKGSDRILSIGCGYGLLEVNLATRGYRVHGVDIDANSLRVARRLAEDSGVAGRCKFRKVEAQRLPFKRESFDVVIYSHSLHHVGNKGRSLKESRRVLKPDGRVAVIEDRKDIPGLVRAAKTASLVIWKRRVLFSGKARDDRLVNPVMLVVLGKGRPPRRGG